MSFDAANPPRANLQLLPQRRVLENAIVRLLKNKPFYGHLLLSFRRQYVESKYPVGVTIANGTPTLIVDVQKLSRHQPTEQTAMLEHVIKHILHLHPVRGRKHNHQVWNLAADLAINPTIAGLPGTAHQPEQFGLEPGLAAEQYVRHLKSHVELGTLEGAGAGDTTRDNCGQLGRGSEQASTLSNHSDFIDDHASWSLADGTPERLAEQAVRDMVQQAHSKVQGDLPEDIRDTIKEWLTEPPIPWRHVLQQFIGTAGRIGRNRTWLRHHRRFQTTTPGCRKKRQLNLLVAIDVSESTNQGPLREAFARELLRISQARQSHITVLYAHSRIRKIERFSNSRAVSEVFHGGGFTDLRPVFDFAKEMNPKPTAVIYITDGYGQAPEKMEIPTLWVLTEDGQKPVEWGVEMRLRNEDSFANQLN
ncbi:MAG: hypothetical protein JRE63_08370 [Deltaproteobacteria bacterium]|jgi:predicted metal-dependent peptidase|nr:hypothetical protein [Deltaproteobacteria bacterium]